MDNSVENMEIRLLEREKWRGFVLAGALLADYSNHDPGRGEVRLDMGCYPT